MAILFWLDRKWFKKKKTAKKSEQLQDWTCSSRYVLKSAKLSHLSVGQQGRYINSYLVRYTFLCLFWRKKNGARPSAHDSALRRAASAIAFYATWLRNNVGGRVVYLNSKVISTSISEDDQNCYPLRPSFIFTVFPSNMIAGVVLP